MKYYFDPLDRACKSHRGAVACETQLDLHLYFAQGGECMFSAQSCTLVLWRNGEPEQYFEMKRGENCFSIRLRFHECGLYFYHFLLDDALFHCGKGRRGTFEESGFDWQITVFDEAYKTPDWFKGGIMYQIFPDRFCRAEGDYPLKNGKFLHENWCEMPFFRADENGKVLNCDFFGGNLNGVREKLPYLKELGVTVIYFNPIFEAWSNHRYDTGDYMKIDQLLGTEEDFDALISEAKKLGIRIILDAVLNHTGDDSRYFNKYGTYDSVGAYQSTASPYAEWYHFNEFPNSYECWWGIDILPEINESALSYQAFMFGEDGVLKSWLRHGIGGYRLDVADELPDFFLRSLRESVKSEEEDAIIIGEVWEDASNKISYDVRREYLQGHELDSVMNYPLKDAIINFIRTGMTYMLRETIAMLLDNYPKQTLDCLMNILSSHDTPRILTVFGGAQPQSKEEMAVTFMDKATRNRAKELLKMAVTLQFTLPGVPCIYYGDEVGMEGFQDPFCRQCFPWDNIDADLNEFYRKIGKIRTGELREVFATGDYREIFADASCIVYAREQGGKKVYVYVNRGTCRYTFQCDGMWREALSGKTFRDEFEIKGGSFGILYQYYV